MSQVTVSATGASIGSSNQPNLQMTGPTFVQQVQSKCATCVAVYKLVHSGSTQEGMQNIHEEELQVTTVAPQAPQKVTQT